MTKPKLFIDQIEELFLGVGSARIESGTSKDFNEVMLIKDTNVLHWQVTNNLHFTVVQSPFQPMQGAQSAEVFMIKDKPEVGVDTQCYWFIMDGQGIEKLQNFLYDHLERVAK
tara:strand:- start:139 stop:477 length:339 start_codon:yes stop_codon:yes gene_type:complete